jgi:hypothetical protein
VIAVAMVVVDLLLLSYLDANFIHHPSTRPTTATRADHSQLSLKNVKQYDNAHHWAASRSFQLHLTHLYDNILLHYN